MKAPRWLLFGQLSSPSFRRLTVGGGGQSSGLPVLPLMYFSVTPAHPSCPHPLRPAGSHLKGTSTDTPGGCQGSLCLDEAPCRRPCPLPQALPCRPALSASHPGPVTLPHPLGPGESYFRRSRSLCQSSRLTLLSLQPSQPGWWLLRALHTRPYQRAAPPSPPRPGPGCSPAGPQEHVERT